MKTLASFFRSSKRSIRNARFGAALVITLALLVLLTLLVVAFLSKSQRALQIATASTAGAYADELARSATAIILSDLQKEIVAGSDNLAAPGDAPLYWPQASVNWCAIRGTKRPQTDETTLLVKQSVNGAFSLGNPEIVSTTGTNTAMDSANRRTVPATRWDKPKLIRNATGSAAGTFQPEDLPEWINITPDGLTASHGPNVVGRFAFNIYDLSGLPDITVSGRPSSNTLDDVAGASRVDLGGEFLPGAQSANADSFLQWRFADAIAGSLADDFPPISHWLAVRGFRPFYPIDEQVSASMSEQEKRLLRRQDFMNFLARPDVDDADRPFLDDVLPFVRTHSASSNTPRWFPETPTNIHGDTSSIDYRAEATGGAPSTNPMISRIVVQNEFTRRDGSTARVGEPLLKRRFPLPKIELVATAGGATATPEEIDERRDYFGLEWDDSSKQWTYTQFTPSEEIKTIDEVAAEDREPNFFETLKAGILRGSLGQNAGDETQVLSLETDRNPDQQIFQIGAAIIDQYDEDDIPTVVLGPQALAYGIENHPYVAQIFLVRTRRRDKDFNPGDGTNPHPWAASWLRFQMWNPHANAETNSYRYRIVGREGETGISLLRYKRALRINPNNGRVREVEVTDQLYQNLTTDPLIDQARAGNDITFEGTTDFSIPTMLGTGNASSSSADNRYGEDDADLVGIFIGDVKADNNWEASQWSAIVGPDTANNFCEVSPQPQNGVAVINPFPDNYYRNDYFGENNAAAFRIEWNVPAQFDLEVDVIGSGDWRLVQRLPPISSGIGTGNDGNPTNPYDPASPPTDGTGGEQDWEDLWAKTRDFHTRPGYANATFMRSDPRTFRFGAAGSSVGFNTPQENDFTNSASPYAAPPATLLPAAAPTRDFTGWNGWGRSGTGWFVKNGDYGPWSNQTGVAYGEFLFNSKDRNCYYPDADGIVRLGDWGPAVDASGNAAVNPMAGDRSVRPVVLNRPFRSVGEMGYAFRGEPWKSLNFHGSDSADSGLLDLFSLADADTVKGRLNVNKATVETLTAMIREAAASVYDPAGSLLEDAEAETLATALHSILQAAPIEQVSELPERIDSLGPGSGVGNWSNTREVIARALADNTDVSTWHLFIDVIAQAGGYPLAVLSPGPEDFNVRGECRYWVHVAMDRHSGKITDIQWEAVIE